MGRHWLRILPELLHHKIIFPNLPFLALFCFLLHFRTLIQGTRGCYQSLSPPITNPESSWFIGAFVSCSLTRKLHVCSGLLHFHKLPLNSMCLLILDPRVYLWDLLTSYSKYSWREKKQSNHILVFFPAWQVLSAWYLSAQSMFIASYKPNPKPLK